MTLPIYQNSSEFDEPVVTLSDMMERIGAKNGGFDGDTRTIRAVKRAIRDALRDLPSKMDWQYYDRELMLRTTASVGLEIEYDHATLTATVTDGDLPTDVAYGMLVISGVGYPIASVDDPDIVLSGIGPGEDYDGTATWCRASYTLPKISNIRFVTRSDNRLALTYVQPEIQLARDTLRSIPSTPIAYTLRQGATLGATDIVLTPPPSTSLTYRISAIIAPPYPAIDQVFSTATGTSGAYTMTCADAKSTWIGTIVRAAPSQASDDKQDALKFQDYEWQAFITNVSGTTVTVNVALPSSFSSETILVSSLIDIAPGPMQTYFEARCHEYYCRNYDHKGLANAISIANKLFLEARGADTKVDQSTNHMNEYVWPFIPVQYGTVE